VSKLYFFPREINAKGVERMEITFTTSTELVTIGQCLECLEVGLDIFVDEGRIITIQDNDLINNK
jgi:hypothetical protein